MDDEARVEPEGNEEEHFNYAEIDIDPDEEMIKSRQHIIDICNEITQAKLGYVIQELSGYQSRSVGPEEYHESLEECILDYAEFYAMKHEDEEGDED